MLDVIEKRYLGKLPLLLGALVILVVCGVLGMAVYAHRPEAPTGPRLAEGAFAIAFEVSPCEKCDDFRQKIGKAYQRSPAGGSTPLRYFDISDGQPPKRFRLKSEVYYHPTVLFFDPYGREMDRVTGAPANVEVLVKMAGSVARRAEREDARLAK